MSSKRLFLIGIALAGVTVILLNVYLAEVRSGTRGKAFLTLAPGAGLARGERLTEEMLRTVLVPESFESLEAVAIEDLPNNRAWILSQPVTRDVDPGSLLLFEQFADEPQERFAARIAAGQRAMTLSVDARKAVAYFVEPGSRVDVIGTFQRRVEKEPAPGASGRRLEEEILTRTVLQNVRVLAVGRATTRGSYLGEMEDGRGFRTVTLEVSPLDAERLEFAVQEASGGLTLVLRNPENDAVEEIPHVSWKDWKQG